MKWVVLISLILAPRLAISKSFNDSTSHKLNQLMRNKITVQINSYSALQIKHLSGAYSLQSSITPSFQIGYSKTYSFKNNIGAAAEISSGVSPYMTKFTIPENKVAAIDFRERIYRNSIYYYWYLQFSLSGAYTFLLPMNHTITLTGGIGIRRDRDATYTNSASYSSTINSPRVTVFSLRTETSEEHRNMLTIPIGVYWEKPFAKRLFLSAGLRFTWLTRDWATGNYIFFPGYTEESRGTVDTGNYYLGIDLGFSWSKKTD